MDNRSRMTSRIVKHAAVIALAATVSVSAAFATVTYKIGNGGLETFNLKMDGSQINGALAGGILLTQPDNNFNSSMPKQYTTLCTDIRGTLYLGQSYTYNSPAVPFGSHTGLNPTWGAANTPTYLSTHSINTANAALAIQNAAYLFYTYGQLTATGLGGDTDHKAALQLAVWSVLYNTDTLGGITGSRFSFSSGDTDAMTLADSWISDLNNLRQQGNFNYNYSGFLLYPNPDNGSMNANHEPPQELLFAPVPEASTVLAGCMMLLPLGFASFKILRRHRSQEPRQ